MHVCMCVILVGAVKVNQDIKGQYADGDYPRTQVSSLMYVCMYDVCMYVCMYVCIIRTVKFIASVSISKCALSHLVVMYCIYLHV